MDVHLNEGTAVIHRADNYSAAHAVHQDYFPDHVSRDFPPEALAQSLLHYRSYCRHRLLRKYDDIIVCSFYTKTARKLASELLGPEAPDRFQL